MKREIIVSPSKEVRWYQVLASSEQGLSEIVRRVEQLLLSRGVPCRVAPEGDKYPLKCLREGVFYTTVPCPVDDPASVATLQESKFTNNRQQAHASGETSYFKRTPKGIKEFDVQTNCEIKPAYVPPTEKKVEKPVKTIVEVPKEDEYLIKQIAGDMCRARGLQ